MAKALDRQTSSLRMYLLQQLCNLKELNHLTDKTALAEPLLFGPAHASQQEK